MRCSEVEIGDDNCAQLEFERPANGIGSPQDESTARGHHRTNQLPGVTTGRINCPGSPQDE